MFEQQSYVQADPVPATQAGDLFHNYEIRNWDLTPRIYKILALSAILNLGLLAFIAETNILTMRGCQSPFVGRVCQVLDTVYVGSILWGTDSEYVDADYEKVQLEDADVTWINVSDASPPLTYPEGYFQLANPEQFAVMQNAADMTGFENFNSPPVNPVLGAGLLDSPAVTPQPNPNALSGEPSSPYSIAGNPTVNRRGRRGGRPAAANTNTNTEPDEDAVAENGRETEAPVAPNTAPVTAVEINRKPMTDFADAVLAKWSAKEIDLNQPFTIVLDGTINADGKLDPKRSKWDTTKEAGDPKMVEIAKQSVEAMSQAGWLGYLRNLGVERINLKLVQDADKMTAVITSSQRTPERAAMISSGFNGLITGAMLGLKDPSDERTLIKAAKVTSDGTSFVVNFEMAKPAVQEMINRNLQEFQAKKQQQPQPNGTATTRPNDNTGR